MVWTVSDSQLCALHPPRRSVTLEAVIFVRLLLLAVAKMMMTASFAGEAATAAVAVTGPAEQGAAVGPCAAEGSAVPVQNPQQDGVAVAPA